MFNGGRSEGARAGCSTKGGLRCNISHGVISGREKQERVKRINHACTYQNIHAHTVKQDKESKM